MSTPIVLDSPVGPEVEIGGRRLVCLGGTSYYSLSSHPDVIAALREGAARWGLSSAGSRTTTGTARPHLELEARLRELLAVDAVGLAASAYLGNAVLAQSLRDEFDVCLLDELAHPSLSDAAAVSGKPRAVFRHGDAEHLRELAREARDAGRRPLILTDAVFATSGVLAPLDAYRAIAAELDAALHVDDAHGFGVLGASGLGTPEHFGIPHAELRLSATFSKALGCFGGFASGPPTLAERLRTSGAYVGATPLPPAVAAAVLTACDLVFASDTLRERLRRNTARVKEGLAALGVEFPASPMPIARFVLGDGETNRRVHERLLERGVLVPFIRYPGGPEGGFFRLAVSAAHTDAHIDQALAALRAAL